jgi:hypothetical protein
MLKYNYVLSVCALALSALALSAQTTAVTSTVKTTAMIGLAQGQTAQLNLLNPGVQALATGEICTAAVSYFDAAGTILKTSVVTVAPGKSGAVDLSGDTDLTIAAGARREIRAQISMPAVPPPTSTGATPIAVAACKLIANLEIYDSVSGRTLVTLGGVHAIPSPVVTPATPTETGRL